MAEETPLVFRSGDDRLVGVLHRPREPGARGVVVVVGGPQYRVGSHRQFLLFARRLAARGVPVLRFDYRGMGDAEAGPTSFERAGPDIGAAIDTFFASFPQLREVVLWGLCDAASAALMYASRDRRVTGLVLLNPWVRQEQSQARTHLRHYYLARLMDAGFWKRLVTGKLDLRRSTGELARTVGKVVAADRSAGSSPEGESFVESMRRGLDAFAGRVLFILSGDDLTAAEFKDEARKPAWAPLMGRETVARRDLAEANHTFSKRVWRDQVADWTYEWIGSW
jgi:uncharacterized protein